jgi:PIN domain nuclease of toxin-antitoxin system
MSPSAMFRSVCVRSALSRCRVQHGHALAVADLPALHRDPFDRLLVAQARDLHLRIVTADRQIARYEVDTLLV